MQPHGQRQGEGQGGRGQRATNSSSAGYSAATGGAANPASDAPNDSYSPYYEELTTSFARIKVVGVGGAGSNAVNRMINFGVSGIEFIAVNTDAQALLTSHAEIAVRIGDKITRGLGAGGRPEVGARAAEESADMLAELVRDADMVFITAGMGGGTGTGASSVIAKLAKSAGALTVGVVTKPFDFEGTRRRKAADDGIAQLRETVDALITIPNERLLHMVDPRTPLTEAFQMADDVLRQGIAGISDLITKPGVINLDFADVKTIMSDAGSALMAIGSGQGESRCADAARQAIASPLLEMDIQGATGVLYNITGGADLTLHETSEAAEIIRAAAHEDAEIIYGTSIDETMGDAVMITLIATGFDDRAPMNDYRYRPGIRTSPPPPQQRERMPQADRGYRMPPQQEPPMRQQPSGPMQPDDDWGDMGGGSKLVDFIRRG
ncbi:MAG: cell division protein FtsZ [Thermomicrobiales bacterium]